jgi:hypothetical protein
MTGIAGITTPVPTTEDYTAPVNTKSRIADKFRRLAEVEVIGHDGQPHAVSAPAAAPVAGSSIPSGQPVTMVNALLSAAASVGADPQALADSERFMVSIGSISPADTEGLIGAIHDAMAANPSIAIALAAPGIMRPNPAQGSSGSGWKPTPTTAADRIRAEAAKAMGQPRPPGSTTY